MLFVLVMEVIKHTVHWLDGQQLLTQLGSVAIRQRVSLYADDMILLVVPNGNDLTVLKATLQIFGQASRLFANLDKSVATPMHCDAQDIQRVQEILSCCIEDFPSRYLGIPLSIFRLKRGGSS
jgi:hypothetical protein